MQIRRAEVSDLPNMEARAREFYASSEFLRGFDVSRFVTAWTPMLESGIGVIFVLIDGQEIAGAIGGVVYPDLYSGELIAVEFFWFVTPAKRGRGLDLYYAFEQWAKEQHCVRIRMTHLCDSMPDSLKWLYGELGFRAIEVNYEKELSI